MSNRGITQARLKELFSYNEDGTFTVLVTTSNRRKKGTVTAGAKRPDGYRKLCVDGKQILMHRAVYLYHHGVEPGIIDHIDRDRGNNRIENLRESTSSMNAINCDRSDNAVVRKVGKSWIFEMNINSVRYRASGFKTEEEAIKAKNTIKEVLCQPEDA